MASCRCLSAVLIVSLSFGAGVVPAAWAQQTPPATSATSEADGHYEAGAAVTNIFRVPGKAIVCGASVVASLVVLGITFGTEYEDAMRFVKNGCSGPWIVEPVDVRKAVDGP